MAAVDRASARRSRSQRRRMAAAHAASSEELRKSDAVFVGRAAQARSLRARSRSVAAPAKQPSFVSVFPTSIVKSMASVPPRHRADAPQAKSCRCARVRGARFRPKSSASSFSPVPNPRSPLTSLTAIASQCFRRIFSRARRSWSLVSAAKPTKNVEPFRSPRAASTSGLRLETLDQFGRAFRRFSSRASAGRQSATAAEAIVRSAPGACASAAS